jgi:hypothetical protein
MQHFLAVCAVALAACTGSTDAPAHAPVSGDTSAADTTARTTPHPPSTTDWTRFGWDVGRSNVMPGTTGITSANVASLRRQQVTIDGTVDASPIYLHGAHVKGGTHDALFVTTSYGKTLAMDADSGTVLWEFTPAGYGGWAGGYRVTTATPVADPGRDYIYAASPDGHVQKLAVADGHVVWSTAITRLPTREKIASSLNYYNGSVIAVTSGYLGDDQPYQGHVAMLDAGTGAVTHVWNSLCSDQRQLIDPASCGESDSGIWGRAGAVVDSTTGNIYVATGNGTWDGRADWGDAVIVLSPDLSRMVGNYTPTNTAQLNDGDTDVGSTAPVLLGGGFAAQGGKDGIIRLLDASVLQNAAAHKGGELQVVQTPGKADLFSAPAVQRNGTSATMYVADGSGTAAWRFDGSRLQQLWSNGNGGTSPVLAGGLLYVYDPSGSVRVYQPDTGQQLANLECGSGHWNSPIVADGRVVLPEGDSNDHATKGLINIWRVP